jgi:hypothetical protein
MQNDKSNGMHVVSLGLAILMDPQAKQQQKRRAAIAIQRVVFKAEDGLRIAAEILSDVVRGESGPTIQNQANDWLTGGAMSGGEN